MKKIKVLFIVAPANADEKGNRGVNGPEKRMYNMLPYWEDYNIEPIYVYPKIGKLFSEFQNSKYKTIDFYVKGKFDFKSIQTLRKIIKENNVDVVMTHGPGSLDFFASIATKLERKKFIFSRPILLDDLQVSNLKKIIFNLFDKISVKLADRIIVVSTDGEKRMKKKYPKYSSKIIKIFNGVKEAKYSKVKRNEFVISMCAQLTENKGWFDFIKVIENLKDKIPNLKAYIIGNGPLYKSLEKEIIKRKLEDVIVMTGYINDVGKYLSKSDLYIMTSYREGLSVAVIEAMSYGLPLILYNFSGSYDQVRENKNGFIVEMGDIEEIVEKVLYIYENKLCDTFGKYSQKIFVENFSEMSMVKNYVNLIREVVNE